MDISKDLVIRFFRDQCSKDQEREVAAWLKASEENTHQAMRWIESMTDEDERLFLRLMMDSQEVWQSTALTIADKEVPNSKMPVFSQEGRRESITLHIRRYVAVAMLLVLAASTVYFYYKFSHIQIATGFGEIKRIVLPDGSRVTLNGNSNLEYKLTNGEFTREVWLEGEGFFDIQHTTDHRKFKVNTGSGKQVEVLGTEFTLMERKGNSRVVLQSGSIRLSIPENEDLLMKPGDLIELDGNRANRLSHVVEKVEPEIYSAWAMAKWQLDGTRLKELLFRVENCYGVQVTILDTALYEKRASGSIPISEAGVDMLLQDIADLFQLQLIKKDKKLILSK